MESSSIIEQEWIVQTEAGDNNVGIYPRYGIRIAFVNPRREAEKIVAAHNAALAAKQRYIDEIRTTTYSDLEKQLVTERQRRLQAEQSLSRLHAAVMHGQRWSAALDDNEKLRDQLLSAQAVIVQIHDHVNGYGERPPALYHVEEICNAVDLSLLHQHDAELRAQWEKEHEQTP